MIYIHKILPYTLYPITIIILLLVWAALSKRRLPVIVALFLLIVTSSPLVSTRLVQYVESDELRKSPADLRTADAIVVLGGVIGHTQGSHGLVYEWSDPDRFFGGIELIKAGMAEKIIFTGGRLPWQSVGMKTEVEILSQYASEFGIPESQIFTTKNVINTKDEAIAVKEILMNSQTKKIILVTSAFHMPRSRKLFEKAGIEVQTYPVDYKVGSLELTPTSFLPSADAFYSFQFAWRELIGRFYYSLE